MRIDECEVGTKIGHLFITKFERDWYTYQCYFISDCDCGKKNIRKSISKTPKKGKENLCCSKECPFKPVKPKKIPPIKIPKIRPRTFVKVGQKYGKLLIKEIWRENNKTLIRCDCDCGTKNYIKQPNYLNDNSGCGCNMNKSKTKKSKYFCSRFLNKFMRKGRTKIINRLVIKIESREFKLSLEDLDILYERQNGLCFYTEEKLILPDTNKPLDSHSYNISIDRVDNSKGYSLENCVLCTKQVNMLKHVLDVKLFISICDKISKNKQLNQYR